MWTLMIAGWWTILVTAVWRVWQVGGPFPAISTFLGLWILSAQIDPFVGSLVTGALAVAIGARAERASKRGLHPAHA